MKEYSYMLMVVVGVLLMVACGQSYEETKRQTRQQRREALRRDSAALKVAVMPTLDCLPLFVAQQEGLLDTLYGGVRLKYFTAQMDCDTALERGRVEGMVTDLVRVRRLEQRGIPMRCVAVTNAYWQLVANRQARVRRLRQLEEKVVGMTRYSATDLLSDWVIDSVRLGSDRIFKVQVNDVHVRMQMLQNHMMDAMWLTEPQATEARVGKHQVVADSRTTGMMPGVLAFSEKQMKHPERLRQLALLMKAYHQACDSLNKNGIGHYRQLVAERCKIKPSLVDSLPKDLRFPYQQAPRQKDVERIDKWLERK